MSTTIVARTYTGSTYTLRVAPDLPGSPATLRHTRDAYTPPEALFGNGRVVNVEDGFDFVQHDFGDRTALVLRVPGVIARTSPILSLTIDGIEVPLGVTRMGA